MNDGIIPRKRRLFFALWPDDDTRTAIEYLIRQFSNTQGVTVTVMNLHLTLAFLGMVDADAQQSIQKCAAGIQIRPFKLRLSECGYFTKSRATFIAPESCPKGLERLVRELGNRLVECGFSVNSHQFRPHVTLLRDSSEPDTLPGLSGVDWQVEKFVLVESITHAEGVEYQVLYEY